MSQEVAFDLTVILTISNLRLHFLTVEVKNIKIVPVNFNSVHKAMLGHYMILENKGRRIAINPDRFDKLITSLRTAVDNDRTLIKKLHHIMIYLMLLG